MQTPKHLLIVSLVLTAALAEEKVEPIDRQALVTRHNGLLTIADVPSPLAVGNGGLAFTADAAGLQKAA